MENQAQTSKTKDRDVTVPLVVSGAMMCLVCACLSVAAYNSREYLQSSLAVPLGLVTPTPVPCPAVPPDWIEIYNDVFRTNSAAWPVGEHEGDYADTELQVRDGRLLLSTHVHGDLYQNFYPDRSQPQKDIYMVTSVRKLAGAEDADYGITWRVFGPRHYYFAIDDHQRLLVYRFDASATDPWEVLHYGRSDLIRPGDGNQLVAFVRGTHFAFCINERLAVELEEDNPYFRTGRFGIAASLYTAGDQASIEYDTMTVYGPAR